MTLCDEIGPDFGLHNEPELGPEMTRKTAHDERRVVRQVTAQYPISKQRVSGRPAGRRHVGQEQLVIRIAQLQGGDEGRCGSGFADGYGVHPDDRANGVELIKPVALAYVLPITWF